MTTSTNVFNRRQIAAYKHSLCLMKHKRHYLSVLPRVEPVMPISLTYIASWTYRITQVLFRVNSIKEQAEVLPLKAFY